MGSLSQAGQFNLEAALKQRNENFGMYLGAEAEVEGGDQGAGLLGENADLEGRGVGPQKSDFNTCIGIL